jgi:hypothetical protein
VQVAQIGIGSNFIYSYDVHIFTISVILDWLKVEVAVFVYKDAVNYFIKLSLEVWEGMMKLVTILWAIIQEQEIKTI